MALNQPYNNSLPEHNLHEMLRDTPAMNDSNNAVHSGTNPTTPQRGYGQHPTSLPLTSAACKKRNNFFLTILLGPTIICLNGR